MTENLREKINMGYGKAAHGGRSKKLKEHAAQGHSRAHMAEMRRKLRAGHTFAQAHRAAKRAVGK